MVCQCYHQWPQNYVRKVTQMTENSFHRLSFENLKFFENGFFFKKSFVISLSNSYPSFHEEIVIISLFFFPKALPYPRQCNPGVLLIFLIFRPSTTDNFGKFSSENTVIFADFSPKMTKICPKYVSWGSNQEGVLLPRIRYVFLLN